jgi:hypothetical protein
MWMVWLTLVGWSSLHGEEASKTAETPATRAGQHTMLFFDDEPLNQRDRVVRRLGRPTLIPESVYHETAGNCAWAYPGVFRDPVTGRWRMVFQAGVGRKNVGGGIVLLLESEDGLRWQPRDTTRELPDLEGRVAPHQILPADRVGEFSSFFVDESAPPEERLKILTFKHHRSEGPLALVWTSPDGLRWRELPSARWQAEAPDPPTFVHWNALRGRYVFTSRPDHSDRRICWFDTKDWRTYSPPTLSLHADALDSPLTQIYGMPVFPYEGIYVGFVWQYHCPRDEREQFPHIYLGGHVNAQFAYSANGLHWIRGFREPFVPNGEPGAPNAGCVQPSSLVQLEDGSLRIYAGGSASEHGHCPPEDGYVMAYALRRDGFAYLESEGGQGVIGTRGLYWRGGNGELNVQAPAGWVRVQVTDSKGNALPGYTFAECEAFRGDSTAWAPRWKKGRALAELSGRMLRLEISLENARLFAVRGDFLLCGTQAVRDFEKSGTLPQARAGF